MSPKNQNKLYLITLMLLFLLNGFSQSVYNIEASYLYGTNLNLASNREFGKTSPQGLEVSIHKYRDGKNHWEKIYNNPQTGWALSWIDHNNNNLGHSFSLNRYMNIVLLRRNTFEFYLKLAQGIMFASNIYESGSRNKTHYNNAVSQYLNFSNDLGIGCNLYPTNHFGFNCSAIVTHFSNGAMSQPNDGLHLFMLKMGMTYVIGDRKSIVFKQPEAAELNKKIKFTFSSGAGFKQLNPENENKFPVFNASIGAEKKLHHASTLNFGTDVFIDTGERYYISVNSKYKGTDYIRIGLTAGHELNINRLGVLTQIGYHVYSPYPAISSFYQKFGLKYMLTKNIFAIYTVRIFNLEVSDMTTFGLGFSL